MSAKSRKNPPANLPRSHGVTSLKAEAIHTVSTQWQGPLPPPGALEQFNQIIPDGAERIMVMCEQEQSARIANERMYAIGEISIEVGGRVVGAILLIACIGAAVWSISVGAYWLVTMGFLSVPVMGTLAKLFKRRHKP